MNKLIKIISYFRLLYTITRVGYFSAQYHLNSSLLSFVKSIKIITDR